jgi:acetyl-CoA C-acetyltransferase
MRKMSNIVICSFARTPIGKFRGSLGSIMGYSLGSVAVKGAVENLTSKSDMPPVAEAYLGNVISAGMGQAPARQAILGASLPLNVVCTTVNKVCASGMKAVMLAAQSLQASRKREPGVSIIAGGFESMSNVPHYLTTSRTGISLGHSQLIDGVIFDGLWDPYNNQHMGMCGEKCAKEYAISRNEQDEYAKESYRRALKSIEQGYFSEVVPVEVKPAKKGNPSTFVTQDEEPSLIDWEKMSTVKPAFDRSEHGTITAANASPLNDGAAALVLMTEDDAVARGIKPLARILGYGDAEQVRVDWSIDSSPLSKKIMRLLVLCLLLIVATG